MAETADLILDAALMHVPFDGWSELTFRGAASDADVSLEDARACSRAGRWTLPWRSTGAATGR
jgi:hypothetical protein